eukprot:TRINITY_DN35329_c0_g1_i1.p1 TRINITY_DN35329_c0_g1~~TRINITY_DN35329_c0_g1_i1.p1  ORF type:complete len:188 (-),score=23.83 TRINITY_DN35329_c0_g1_i1:193-756(-)
MPSLVGSEMCIRDRYMGQRKLMSAQQIKRIKGKLELKELKNISYSNTGSLMLSPSTQQNKYGQSIFFNSTHSKRLYKTNSSVDIKSMILWKTSNQVERTSSTAYNSHRQLPSQFNEQHAVPSSSKPLSLVSKKTPSAQKLKNTLSNINMLYESLSQNSIKSFYNIQNAQTSQSQFDKNSQTSLIINN